MWSCFMVAKHLLAILFFCQVIKHVTQQRITTKRKDSTSIEAAEITKEEDSNYEWSDVKSSREEEGVSLQPGESTTKKYVRRPVTRTTTPEPADSDEDSDAFSSTQAVITRTIFDIYSTSSSTSKPTVPDLLKFQFHKFIKKYNLFYPYELPEGGVPDLKDISNSTFCYCPRVYYPVCASNGRTYVNECVFNCIKRRSVRIVRPGACINYRRTVLRSDTDTS